MSLSPNEKEATKEEFRANIELAGLTRSAIAADLGISAAKLERILNLHQRSLEDAWILRNYLLTKHRRGWQSASPVHGTKG